MNELKKYMFTILLLISVGIGLPSMWEKIYDSHFENDLFLEEDNVEMENPEGTEESDSTVVATEDVDASMVETETVIEEQSMEGVETSEPITGQSKEFVTVDRTYWEDALFVGDSRTVGLSDYSDLGDADVFASTGMSVYKVFSTKVSVPDYGKVTLEELLQDKKYGKIYFMMGINELGYPYENTVEKYRFAIEHIEELQPDTIIFLGANLHVTEKKSNSDRIFNNDAINSLNQAIKEMSDGVTKFYIDVNEIFDDETGSLDQTYTTDDAHVLGKYYDDWAAWLLSKGIEVEKTVEEVKEIENTTDYTVE